MSMPITLMYASIFAFFALVLSFKAGTFRGSTGISVLFGEPSNMELAQRVRAHQNFLEYVPVDPREVLECFATSGEADFHLRVVVEDIDAYNAFLDGFIFRLPGVSQVRSNIVLKEIKADTALPFRL